MDPLICSVIRVNISGEFVPRSQQYSLMLGFVAEQEQNSLGVSLPVIQFGDVGLKIRCLVGS